MNSSGVRFTKSGDGESIAYRTWGSGAPLVLVQNLTFSHVELEWSIPDYRTLFEELGEHHHVIRLDPPGTGLSSGPGGGFEKFSDAILAVVDAIGCDTFDLMAAGTMAGPAVVAAATGRVQRLVLCDPLVDSSRTGEVTHHLDGAGALAETGHADLVFDLFSSIDIGEYDSGPLQEVMRTNLAAWPDLGVFDRSWSVVELLPEVRLPTLVLHTRGGWMVDPEHIREVAAALPDARMAAIDGFNAPYMADQSQVVALLGDFFDWKVSEESVSGGLSVIVFTDIVDSTQEMDRLGDEAARTAMRSIEELVSDSARAYSGAVIKQLGDGSLLEFASASNAIEFARKVQVEMQGSQLQLRVGMAAGEPIHESGDVHGAVVVVASRVCDEAGAGEVMVSGGVRQLLVGKQLTFQDQGERDLKGFDDPIRIWQLET